MKILVVVFLLVCFLAVPVGRMVAEPFCDYALYSGKVIDWVICGLFAWIMGLGEYDEQGNITLHHP